MDKKTTYYVSRKNALTWIAAALMACSIFARIAFFCEKGADTTTVWLQIVLPVFASVLYILQILTDGQEHFYKTATPVLLLGIYHAARVFSMGFRVRYLLLHWIVYLAAYIFYHIVVGGRYPRLRFVLWIAMAGVAAFFFYDVWDDMQGQGFLTCMGLLRDCLTASSMLFGTLAAREHTDGKYHHTFGDRKDGRRIRNLNPISRVANYIMPTAMDAPALTNENVPYYEESGPYGAKGIAEAATVAMAPAVRAAINQIVPGASFDAMPLDRAELIHRS